MKIRGLIFLFLFVGTISCKKKNNTDFSSDNRSAAESANAAATKVSAMETLGDNLEILSSSETIYNGMTQKFVAVTNFTDGTIHNVTADAVWSIENTEIGSFSSNKAEAGLFTAKTLGKTSVIATFNQMSDKFALTVSDAKLLNISIAPVNTESFIGKIIPFKAKGVFSNNDERDITKDVSWESNSDGLSIVNEGLNKGTATAIKLGKVTIKANFYEQGATAEVNIIATPEPTVTPAATVTPKPTDAPL